MRAELQAVLSAARQLPPEELPKLLGELEEIRCTAMARLIAPVPSQPPDELLDVEAAARRLGMSKDYLYRHADSFPFTRRMGRSLRFSARGIDAYIKQHKHIDSKTAKAYSSRVGTADGELRV